MVGAIVAIVGAISGILAALAPILIALINKGKSENKDSTPPVKTSTSAYIQYLELSINELAEDVERLTAENRILDGQVVNCLENHGGNNAIAS